MSAAGQPLFSRRIDFHPARRPYTGVPVSSGDFVLEILNPGCANEQRATSWDGVESQAVDTGANDKKSMEGESREHELDPELSFRTSFKRIGAGLENLGNTCYLNSVLQCLTYTEPFAAYLQSGKHKSTCRATGFCAMCALQNHVMDALQSTGKILRPFHFVRNLRCISRSFRNSRQEDAHEYMINLLESMHKCCLPSGVQSESHGAYENSLVHKIFGGQLRSQVKCMQCSYCSDKFDPFLDLSLEIVRDNSLRKAFAHFTATEQLDGGERQYQCQRCKEKVQAFKQLTIYKAPYVLTIHLKRFGSSIRREKINKKVEFEPTLDVRPFFSGVHEGDLKYTLYGVLVHNGWSTHSGHYFCYVRTSAGLWYSLDDNHVSQVSEKTVLSREAYMLFYVKDRTSTIKKSIEVRDDAIIHDLPVSVNDSSRQHLFKHQEPLGKKEGHTTMKDSCLQVNDDVSSHGMLKTMLPTNKTELLVSVKSQLPSFDTKKGNANKRKMENSCTPYLNDDKQRLGLSNAMNTLIKEATSAKLHQANDIKKSLVSLQGQKSRESFLNLLEAKPVSTTNSCVYGETSTIPEIGNLLDGSYQTRVITKKKKVPFLAEGSYFWRKNLFFMSLRFHRTKKKKTKKQHQSLRNKKKSRKVDLLIDYKGASKPETYQTVDVDSMHSFEKDLHPTSGKKSKRDKINNYHQTSDIKIYRSCMDGSPGASKQPIGSLRCIEGQQSVNINNDEDDNILQNSSMSLLKASLREATVARWDTEDLPTLQLNGLEDPSKRNIGYLLDDWDEEYDRGKRKKLKSRQWFDGSNPFQKTAEMKTQQRMKAFQTSFGREPLRI